MCVTRGNSHLCETSEQYKSIKKKKPKKYLYVLENDANVSQLQSSQLKTQIKVFNVTRYFAPGGVAWLKSR